jgi:hypothetical protein
MADGAGAERVSGAALNFFRLFVFYRKSFAFCRNRSMIVGMENETTAELL